MSRQIFESLSFGPIPYDPQPRIWMSLSNGRQGLDQRRHALLGNQPPDEQQGWYILFRRIARNKRALQVNTHRCHKDTFRFDPVAQCLLGKGTTDHGQS